MIYPINNELSLEGEANNRFSCPSGSELDKYHGFSRCIGGDHGDLLFDGFDVENGKTILSNPHVFSFIDLSDATDDEIHDLAMEILLNSFNSIGLECVEHS